MDDIVNSTWETLTEEERKQFEQKSECLVGIPRSFFALTSDQNGSGHFSETPNDVIMQAAHDEAMWLLNGKSA
jgi:hypothetical protein